MTRHSIFFIPICVPFICSREILCLYVWFLQHCQSPLSQLGIQLYCCCASKATIMIANRSPCGFFMPWLFLLFWYLKLCSYFYLQMYLPQWNAANNSRCTAIERVGVFLENVLQNHSLHKPIEQAEQLLHYAPNLQQSQLLCLIVTICKGIPKPYEVFHCQESSTQGELSLFLKRMEREPLRYLVMEVNKLPNVLQEVSFVVGRQSGK